MYEEAARKKEKCKGQNKEPPQTSAVKATFIFHFANIFCLLFNLRLGFLPKGTKLRMRCYKVKGEMGNRLGRSIQQIETNGVREYQV